MAFDNNQSESTLPTGVGGKRTSLDLLPKYFRTGVNQKFLNATVDQLISEGEVDKVNAFIGRRTSPAHKTEDRYLEDISTEREAYQLEPALVSFDNLDNVTFFKDYYDYVNQLSSFSRLTTNHSLANSEEYYAWNPHIDWDKFVNYREYYWLPTGPQAITILGKAKGISSEYSVTLRNDIDNVAYIFAPKDIGNGLLANPTIKLYRGQTYRFNLNCKGRPMALKTVRETGDSFFFTNNVRLYDSDGKMLLNDDDSLVSNVYIEEGIIEVTFDEFTPNILYYVSSNDINTSGFFTIYDIEENTEIDVSTEIVGLKNYTTHNGINLANGMKIRFDGIVTPEKYATGNWYVEGVGKQIALVSERDLETPAKYTYNSEIEFDNENFDTQGFDVNNNYPKDKDYIVINRSSKDRNPWSRHNRWFHRSVIETAAAANNQTVELDQSARAKRPIIEFEPNIKLWKFGRVSKRNVTVVDDFTTDVFSTIEGSLGYNVDGVSLVEGMRVLFTADPDVRVNGRIFKVATFTHLGTNRITLLEDSDTEPQEFETVLVTDGVTNRGKMFHYINGQWLICQEKTALNQTPMFDVYDATGVSYGDSLVYPGSTFQGTKLFSYKPGSSMDVELGFGITYRNVGNFGDIVFDFNLHLDTFEYQKNNALITSKIDAGYLVEINSLTSVSHVNGWEKTTKTSYQPVVQWFNIDGTQVNFFEIDVYDNSGLLTDLQVRAYVNGKRQYDTDFTIYRQGDVAYVQFYADLKAGDTLTIKSTTYAPKNNNGYYEFPFNLENNPNNLSLDSFTLGEVNNHVMSIADNIPNFRDTIPGRSSLKDYGNITPLGTVVVQHSAPLMPVIYHITNKNFNIIKALKFARQEYSKFKRNFIRVATESGYTGIVREHFDLIMKSIAKDGSKGSPFYLSDMVPVASSFIFQQEVIDNSITDYPLTFDFNLNAPSQHAVLVYLNDQILLHGKDYVFTSNNFVRILTAIKSGDDLKIVQYEQTDGCCVPPTPTKFGLYPLFEPKIYVDTTYQTPTKVIQGHDGSIVVAFNDYRDDLILELERRIFNNIKVPYDPSLLDIYDFVSGYNRVTDLSTPDLNAVLASDFLRWTGLVGTDYTQNTFYEQDKPQTYNYSKFKALNGSSLPGFWRGIFKLLYDTDRPNTHPWEMLGFSTEPIWWVNTYGPAPYTSDNLIMWKDLAEGLVKEPGKNVVKNVKFARPDLLSYLPVDNDGNLRSPLELGIVTEFVSTYVGGEYTFGDHGPVETAWRRSSEFPFALLTALTILRPAKVFATCFDRVRQFRDDTGQIVYATDAGNLRFNIENLTVPSTSKSTSRIFTAGLVNYIVDHIISVQSVDAVDTYIDEISNLKVRLSSKLGGFTTKEKFKLVLDSRSPLNSGNVFVPEENYRIELNISSPVVTVNYSGVIVERQPTGYVIKGYNTSSPIFRYFPPLDTASDPVINVGGISESFVTWSANQYYSKETIVSYEDAYYRTKTAHTSALSFESKYFSRLSKLPIVGGRDIILRRRFNTEVSTLHYGAELKTVQDVVDFLLGYGRYLESIGFKFENYNDNLKTVTDFQASAKEFAFWTTQNWAAGAVISLSPCAEAIQFQKDYVVVDSILDSFYEYSVLKQDGNTLEPLFTNNLRKGNSYTLKPRNTADGIYNVSLNLVQKEHVLILDNVTVFNDIIYDQIQGYRQERIKVVGYRTSNWQGDFDVPGFVYDNAIVKDWKPWTDFNLGDTVKYKEFYYSAKTNVAGSEEFEYSYWVKLTDRPVQRLIPNWEYRATQFTDFYDLDTHSFDINQQKFAQHLIGYQPRQYLENIINDDVSQYKFYQGMIQDKGTQNVLSKLFDALSTADVDSLEFYEEWAIRLGQYGANAGFEEIEYLLDENKFLINPQPIELVNRIDPTVVDFVYRILPDQVYIKTVNYNHAPLPIKPQGRSFVSTAGYVREEDVEYSLGTLSDVLSININTLTAGDHFWVGTERNSWNVYRFTLFATEVRSVSKNGQYLRFTLRKSLDGDIKVGDYVGINNPNASDPVATQAEGFHVITGIGFNYIEIVSPEPFDLESLVTYNFNFFKFVSVRISNISSVNDLAIADRKDSDLVWVDGTNGKWSVWKYNKSFSVTTIANNEDYFGSKVSVDYNNTTLVVNSNNKIFYYSRPTDKANWVYRDQLTVLSTQGTVSPNTNLVASNNTYGQSLDVDATGEFLVVGVPGASTLTGAADSANSGYVAFYRKNDNGYFTFVKAIISTLVTPGEKFGLYAKFLGNRIIIAAEGSNTVAASLTAYSLTGTPIFGAKITFPVGVKVVDLATSNEQTLAVSLSNGEVKVIDFINNSFVVMDTKVAPATLGVDTEFGASIDITSDGSRLAIGIPGYSIGSPLAGAVLVYNGSTVELLTNPSKREGEKFGSLVKFTIDGSQLVVRAQGGFQADYTQFDVDKITAEETTVFDLGTTYFEEKKDGVGSLAVYDYYDTKFIFSKYLNLGDPIGVEFGEALDVTDRVYAGDYSTDRGAVYEFKSANKGWYKLREPATVVDIEKIKSVFLYDTETETVVQYLDVIDPHQGKILGIAEQELKFKTYYDPATYSVGNDEVVVDNLMPWLEKNVGMLWWDLGSAKFINAAQGSILSKANTWNTTYLDEIVSVYEWIESEYMPSEWDALADTEEGLTAGISGQSKYGDACYSYRKTYDTVSKTFRNVYYFWVKNKTLTPSIEGRLISAKDVANYITNPKDMGVSYITLLDSNQFALVNCKELITGKKVALNIRYWIIDNAEESNIHSHYQLISAGDISKPLNKYIEQKWFDSLSGFDSLGNEVPDSRLPAKLKYGVLSRPRQGMFVNREEALKQFIERVNSVLLTKSLIDDYNFDQLNSKELPPSIGSGKYDVEITNYSEIRFVGTNDVAQAKLVPVVENGKIIRVDIVDAGKGYINAPNVVINGIGTGASIKTTIGDQGQLISAIVDQAGIGYLQSTTLTVRPLSVLVTADETANGKWVLYSWDNLNSRWFRENTQTYDTTRYWQYVDWYASGYNEFTKIDHVVDFVYQLPYINIDVGDIVKVKNQGAGGWILLEKIDSQTTLETTVNYKTIGRERGTIQFTENLYKFKSSSMGYDGPIYDTGTFDDQPKTELKIILECIRDSLLVEELATEYKALFFASLRYIFNEQKHIDWAFKTSFVRSKHNLGALEQKSTYQNDNLDSYIEYINEVKPYRSKVREFVSSYTNFDSSASQVTDFDLPVRYDSQTGKLTTFSTSVINGIVSYDSNDIKSLPYSDWLYNAGYSLISIEIVDSGEGYIDAPIVEIVGAPTSITTKAFISSGRVTKIIFDDPLGELFVTTPVIKLNGTVSDTGRPGRAVAIIGNGKVRSTKIGIKFDRVSSNFTFADLQVTETFTGTGSRTRFELDWPIDIVTTRTTVTDNNGEVLGTDYTVFNEVDPTYSYTRYKGILQFNTAPEVAATLVIQYYKNIDLLDAADRINHFYNPQPGQLGKDLGQLMQGVDYGGVEVTGVDFNVGSGWDALPWFTSGYDVFDPEFTDFLIKSDGTTRSFMLNYIPTDVEIINIYVNGSRIDDPNYTVVKPLLDQLATQQSQLSVLQAELTALEIAVRENTALINQLGNTTNGLVYLKELEIANNNQEIAAKKVEITAAKNASPYDEFLVRKLEKQLEVLEDTALVLNQDLIDLNAQLVAAINAKNAAQAATPAKQAQVDAKAAEVASTQAQLNALPSIVNKNAIMNSFLGDGLSSGPIVIPSSFNLNVGDTIILRKSTSDGSFNPSDIEFDTQLFGGDFSYTSATGIKPEDINVDGDGFITPYTSHAPEEVITGQLVDTVDISVYHKVSDGAPVIETQLFYANGVNTFALTQKPVTESAVIVKIARSIATEGVDYTLDFENQTVTVDPNIALGTEISITTISQNGLNILDMDFFVGDGATTQFITVARWNSDYTVFVTVNGIAAEVTTFKTDQTYELDGNIGIEFSEAPAADSIISYTVLGSPIDSISKVQKETITHDGTNNVYALSRNPEFVKPLANNVLVIYDGKLLRPADTVYFKVAGSSRTFTVDTANYAYNSVDSKQVTVFVNGKPIVQPTEYQWFPANNQLKIKRGVANTGDTIAIVIDAGSDYTIELTESSTNLKLFGSYAAGNTLQVVSFSNHDILDIQRHNDYIKSASVLEQGLPEYYRFNQLTGGRIKLSHPAVGPEYVWITMNRELLTPNIDYVLEANLNYIRFKSTITLVDTDVIDVIAFSNKVTRSAFGYRIFKDMLNKNSYFRIDDSVSTELAAPLYYYDSQMVVTDASGLAVPNAKLNRPGVVIIDSERIEYYRKDGNVLGQLRRGTLGTGVKNSYAVGTQVRDQSRSQGVPYKDEFISSIVRTDGYTNASKIYSNSSSVTVTDISVPTDDGTCSPKGGDVVTVTGTGFEENVKVIVGDTECTTVRVSSTSLTFVTPNKLPGVYDLVVFNAAIEQSNRVQTSRVVPAAMKYLKVAIEFTPMKSIVDKGYAVSGPATWTKDGYTTSVPDGYIQADDIEVFVAGNRLHKTPYTVWSPVLGPDSPSGDVKFDAEFAVTGKDAFVRLTAVPPPGVTVVIQKRLGKSWTAPGVGLLESSSNQANFIKSTHVVLPK